MQPYNQYDRPSLPAENSVNLTCDPKWPFLTYFWPFLTILGHKSGSQNFLLGEMVGHIDCRVAWDQALPLFHWDHLASLLHPGVTPAAKRPKLGYFGHFESTDLRGSRWLRIGGTTAFVGPGHQLSNKQSMVGIDGAGRIQWVNRLLFLAMAVNFFSATTVYTLRAKKFNTHLEQKVPTHLPSNGDLTDALAYTPQKRVIQNGKQKKSLINLEVPLIPQQTVALAFVRTKACKW